ncbi:MAG: hypothetical protein ACI9G1_001270 [Pirellulaceae bacterium]|jgi:hypothetical protein
MPIPVGCQCGQRFAAPDNLAGKAVRCPKCGNPLQIPNPQAEQPQQQGGVGDLLDEVGVEQHAPVYQGPACPSCTEPVKEEQVICVNCGYNLKTKKKLKTRIEHEEKKIKEIYGNSYLDRAAHNIDQKKLEIKVKERSGVPWWALLVVVIFCGTTLLAGAAYVITPNVDEDGEETTGSSSLDPQFLMGLAVSSVVFIGSIINVIGWVQLLIHAFNENSTEGCMVLLIPSYWLAYIFERWNECRDYMNLLVGGTCMMLFPLAVGLAFGDEIGILHRIVLIVVCVLIVVGSYLTYAGRLLIVVKAFRDDSLQGVLALLVPIYDFIYAARNWATCKSAVYIYLGGVASIISGWLILIFVVILVVVTDENLITSPERDPVAVKAELKRTDFRKWYAEELKVEQSKVIYLDVENPSIKAVNWHIVAITAYVKEGLPAQHTLRMQGSGRRFEWAIGPLSDEDTSSFLTYIKSCEFGDANVLNDDRSGKLRINLPLLQSSKWGQAAQKK